MNKKFIKIIDIKLDIDLAEEIKSKVDSLSSEVIEHTKELVRKNGVKIQRVNKKQKARQERDRETKLVITFLEESFETPDRWVEGKELLEEIDAEATSPSINKLSLRIRKLLKKEGKWVLSKKRRSNKTVYRLIKFS